MALANSLFGQADTPTIRDSQHGAYIVTPSALRSIDAILRSFVAPHDPSAARLVYEIVGGTERSTQVHHVDGVLAHRNSRTAPIEQIVASCTAGDREAHVYLSNTAAYRRLAAAMAASAPTAEPLNKVYQDIRNEFRAMRAPYWPLQYIIDRCFDRLLNIPERVTTAIFLSAALVCLGWLLLTGGTTAWKYFASQSGTETGVREVVPRESSRGEPAESVAGRGSPRTDEAATDSRESAVIPWRWIWRILIGVALGAAIVIFGALSPAITHKVFPRVVFRIGDGEDRYHNLKFYQRFVLLTVLICSIGIPALRSVVAGYLARPADGMKGE